MTEIQQPLNGVLDSLETSALECLVIVGGHHGLHLTVRQIVQDNALFSTDISIADLVRCASGCGLKAKAVNLDWSGLEKLKRALPVIVRLKTGAHLVLEKISGGDEGVFVVLRDPKHGPDSSFPVDRPRFEQAWTGDVVLLRRNHDVGDDEQPFSFGMIASLALREGQLTRDLFISAFFLSLFAVAPIMYWRLTADYVLYYGAFNTFAALSIGIAAVVLLETAFTFTRGYLLNLVTAKVDIKLSEFMFEKVLHLPIEFFERREVGLLTRDMNEMWRIRSFLTGTMANALLDSLTLFIILPILFFFSVWMTVTLLVICLLIVAWLLIMLPALRKASSASVRAEGERAAFLVQTLQGMRTVKSLALEPRQHSIWDVLIAKCAKLKLEEGYILTRIQTGVKPLERLAVNGVFALGVYQAMTSKDPLLIGELFAFLMLSQRVASPLMQIASLINQWDEVRNSVDIVGNIVNQPREEGQSRTGVRVPLQGLVEFSNVWFTYKGANSPAIKNLSFEAPIGTTLGVVGRSGSGKTTVTRLLQRLHPDYEGLIKIDGVDIRAYDLAHMRRSLGVVLQENYLFSGTIRDNITAARSNASFDEVCRAARLAGAEEFIEKLPLGYDTWIYEGSPNLSGGQRQRLAIARALIVDPRILVLDEATSALDPDSEAIVNANIKRIAQGRTVIVISHRLSALVNSDAIMVLERGEMLDLGTHDELIARCEVYRSLWNQQNGHVEAAMKRGPQLMIRGPQNVS